MKILSAKNRLQSQKCCFHRNHVCFAKKYSSGEIFIKENFRLQKVTKFKKKKIVTFTRQSFPQEGICSIINNSTIAPLYFKYSEKILSSTFCFNFQLVNFVVTGHLGQSIQE